MKTLFAAVLVFILLSAQVFAATKLDCIPSARWGVKILSDSGAAGIDFKPVDTTIERLWEVKPVDFLMPFSPRQAPEYRVYRVICRIKYYSTALDGDLNMVLEDPDNPAYTMYGEVPNPDCFIVEGSPYKERFREVWKEFRTLCSTDGNIIEDMERHPVKEGLYEVTGVCFLDLPHPLDGAAENYAELHPVLSIRKTNWLRHWLFKHGF